MSGIDDIKQGDHIRVTVEGVAACVSVSPEHSPVGRFVYINSADVGGLYIGGLYTSRGGVTIEKVAKPLPTTPGSVVRGRRSGSMFMLLDNGVWVSQFDEARSATAVVDVEVIYDAGKTN